MRIYKQDSFEETKNGFKVIIKNICYEPKVANVNPQKDIVRKSYYYEKQVKEKWEMIFS